jgi:release factor glutamine methyltransferase
LRAVLKHIVANTYKPLLVKYLSRTRIFRYGDISLEIHPQVFHPGFFFSTRLLLRYIRSLSLSGKKILELGAGNGLISVYCSRNGATVVASDINPVAIEYLHKNSLRNNTFFEIILSDLFAGIPSQEFDLIAINPPYYKKQPLSLIDHAWYCGENGEYFSGLFDQLAGFINKDTGILMALCEGCDIKMIEQMANQRGFQLRCLLVKQNLLEKTFLYKIELRQ